MGIMRIFDGLYVDQLFQKNELGETVFYPHGLMGRGYRVPADRESSIRGTMRILMVIALAVGIGFGILALRIIEQPGAITPMGWVIGGGAFILFLVLITTLQSRLATGLEPVSEPRPSAGTWLKRGRQARARWTHWACIGLGVFSLLLAGAGFAFGLAEEGLLGFLSGVFFLTVGALLTWDGVMGLIERREADTAR